MEESLLIKLGKDPAVDMFSPVIDRRLRLNNGELVHLLGIDPFLDRAIRPEISKVDFLDSNANELETFLSFLIDERAALVDNDLKAELGIPPQKTADTAKGFLHVKGSFPNPSGEPLVIMDIGHAQKLYQLQGSVDRVDLILSDEPGSVSRWGKGFLIQSCRQRSETFSGMLQAFRLNLEALSLLALFVGVYLIYHTAMFTVVSRRRDYRDS